MNKALLFILIAFVVNWGMAAVYYFSGYTVTSPEYFYFSLVYMITPFLIAFIVQKIIYGQEVSKSFLLSFKLNKWILIGWITPVAIALLTFIVGLLLPGISFSTDMESLFEVYLANQTPEYISDFRHNIEALTVPPVLFFLVKGLVSGATTWALFTLSQEIAWRGFLLSALRDKGYFNASMLIGLVWGFWYAPLILMGQNFPQHPVAGVFMFTLICVFLSPVFTFITLKSGSILTAAIMNGTLNTTLILAYVLLKGGSDLTLGVYGLAGVGGVLVVMAVVMDYDKISEARIFRQ